MEPDSLPRPDGATPRPVAPPPSEWRALSRLRERVEDAALEVERLRAQNAALAAQVVDLQAGLGADSPGLALPASTDPDVLRVRIQSFIDAIDDVLASPDEDADAAGPDGDGAARLDVAGDFPDVAAPDAAL